MTTPRSPRGGWFTRGLLLLCVAATCSAASDAPRVETPRPPAARTSSDSPTTVPARPTLRATSDPTGPADASLVLHDGCNWTLTPHGSILSVPENMQIRIGSRPVGSLLSLREFRSLDRAFLGRQRPA